MSFWSWFLGENAPVQQPSIRFGRYSDSYKAPANYEAWSQSLSAFEQGDFMECYRQFFFYLRDEKEDNVQWVERDGHIDAVLIQGSQKVTISANSTYFKAATHIAKATEMNIGLMRRLLEQNNALDYGHYALADNGELTIIFTSYAQDGSPYKLYYALKEIATISDKQDNLLLEEFKGLQIIYPELRREMPEAEKEIKYQFVCESLNAAFNLIDNATLPLEQHPKIISYVLFSALFRIEYLTCPEGQVMEVIERAYRKFNDNDGKNIVQKNQQLHREATEILQRSKEKHLHEMYRVSSTFGITVSASHERLNESIKESIVNAEWYEKNKHWHFAQAIYDYIAGLLVFSYALPKIDKDALALYFEVREQTYFSALGFSHNYVDEKGILLQNNIEKRLMQICQDNKEKYPKVKFDVNKIDFTHMGIFSKTFLLELTMLDVSK